ncbi:NADH:flavin oxidoreductase/NADH oxidase [Entomomonas moraniae]|uniref:NADH:flavin oxidoreductase/NADH oxidase n=1 Tax=Entomomonas moraniae TaxID=2213226 RepID=A0A3Q9JNL8_9GAMM|nr:NADH:flavin oxidoreductase/NADH oxidase [Entomomonas moraniae]AZS50927.1 NADH:flavin oxidoreductase/NADH oxidase [Entomomonas moraniae]
MAKLRHLTTPYTIKNLSLKNRIVMPPMCQYQAKEGMPNDWHFVHYASRAVGGVGLIIIEMTNILPNGRISPNCLGLWNDAQRDQFKRIVDIVHKNGSKIAIQIAHAGRKALGEENVVSSSEMIYEGSADAGDGKWAYKKPRALSKEEIHQYIQAFQDSVKRAVEAGFDAIELHGAHGYLIHQFYSPKLNQRTDEYGQDKMLFGEQVIKAAKAVMSASMPLIIRISAQEYGKDGFDLAYGCEVAKRFAEAGVDMIDVSGGGDGQLDPQHTPVFNAGYQVYLAEAVKKATNLPVIAVGMLEDAQVADHVLNSKNIELVAIGRALLRDPYWLLNAQYNQVAKDNNGVEFVPESYKGSFL